MDILPEWNNPQTQSLTSALANICRDYPAGGGILRELLQNADDAGASTVVCYFDLTYEQGLSKLSEVHP